MSHRALKVASIVGFAAMIGASAEAGPHRRHHHGYYSHTGGYPSVHLSYGSGWYPASAFGYGHFPTSLGLTWLGGPKDPRGSLRFDVEPRHTEVYVDGYYAGIVDDFDGAFGKLRLEPGPHDVSLYLDGHRVFEETLYSSLGSSVKIRHEMERLAPGEPEPMPPALPGPASRRAPAPRATSPALPSPSSAPIAPGSSGFGVLALRAQPGDAELWIDGERWHVSGVDEQLLLHLPAGSHELALLKTGFQSFETSVSIDAEETTVVNVRLGASAPEPPD